MKYCPSQSVESERELLLCLYRQGYVDAEEKLGTRVKGNVNYHFCFSL